MSKTSPCLVYVGEQKKQVHFDCVPEDGIFTAELEMAQPELWWPAGYGKQPLYEVTAVLSADGKEITSQKRKIGFRHVAVDQQSHPEKGRYFVFRINHQPIFMKGSNLVPNDMINAAMTSERYEKLVALAQEANFNFLRIWGGGVYESDALYEICDQCGILLWQEFVAACAVVPAADQTLLDSFQKRGSTIEHEGFPAQCQVPDRLVREQRNRLGAKRGVPCRGR